VGNRNDFAAFATLPAFYQEPGKSALRDVVRFGNLKFLVRGVGIFYGARADFPPQ
jgi:hypothetical protein